MDDNGTLPISPEEPEYHVAPTASDTTQFTYRITLMLSMPLLALMLASMVRIHNNHAWRKANRYSVMLLVALMISHVMLLQAVVADHPDDMNPSMMITECLFIVILDLYTSCVFASMLRSIRGVSNQWMMDMDTRDTVLIALSHVVSFVWVVFAADPADDNLWAMADRVRWFTLANSITVLVAQCALFLYYHRQIGSQVVDPVKALARDQLAVSAVCFFYAMSEVTIGTDARTLGLGMAVRPGLVSTIVVLLWYNMCRDMMAVPTVSHSLDDHGMVHTPDTSRSLSRTSTTHSISNGQEDEENGGGGGEDDGTSPHTANGDGSTQRLQSTESDSSFASDEAVELHPQPTSPLRPSFSPDASSLRPMPIA